MGQGSTSDPVAYLSASSVAAVLNFPLWKAATIGQSGFAHAGDSLRGKMRILFGPPYKGVAATMFGMTWARAAIFYCSDTGKRMLQQRDEELLETWEVVEAMDVDKAKELYEKSVRADTNKYRPGVPTFFGL